MHIKSGCECVWIFKYRNCIEATKQNIYIFVYIYMLVYSAISNVLSVNVYFLFFILYSFFTQVCCQFALLLLAIPRSVFCTRTPLHNLQCYIYVELYAVRMELLRAIMFEQYEKCYEKKVSNKHKHSSSPLMYISLFIPTIWISEQLCSAKYFVPSIREQQYTQNQNQ